MMLPIAGWIAYFVVEVLPEFRNSRTGRVAAKVATQTLAPNKDLKQAADVFAVSDTIDNALTLANALYEKGLFQEAKALYEKCLNGIHSDDPHIMLGLAKTEFKLNHFKRVNQLLDDLIEAHPDFKNADAHLLYTRALEERGLFDKAMEEYEALHRYYPGPEASIRYAQLCQQLGQTSLALSVYRQVVAQAKIAGRHYHKQNKYWIKLAKTAIDDSTSSLSN